ncbi:hypothetical protein [Dyadobacter sp. NIV53]|uniref:hypothetical protein n=1 Tax=Dyadobacter sp. NIV53 TaxID=2861765 RepID=UPI001C867C7A|nr:hypothetical protein [Dyadobacter sp. NIV53]
MSAKKRPNEETEFQQMTDDSCPDYSRLRIAALKLRFPAALEEEYLENYYKLTFFTPVKGIIIATVVYLSFAGLDIFASPEKSNNIIFVRFAVGLIALIGIIITYLKKLKLKTIKFHLAF